MLRFCTLASGSNANATIVHASNGLRHTRLLIDCGLGWRPLQTRLSAIGLCIDDIDALFITHEHSDHTAALPQLLRHAPTLPVYASAGTWHALRQTVLADGKQANHHRQHAVADGMHVTLGELQLHPFTVPHDAREPLQLRCTDGQRQMGIATDFGHATPHALRQLQGCHALLLESNHDSGMLAASAYPAFLKRRIAGAYGHLSNAQAAQALHALRHAQLHTVVAAHLSERNNQPHLAQTALAQALGCSPSDILVADRAGSGQTPIWLSV